MSDVRLVEGRVELRREEVAALTVDRGDNGDVAKVLEVPQAQQHVLGLQAARRDDLLDGPGSVDERRQPEQGQVRLESELLLGPSARPDHRPLLQQPRQVCERHRHVRHGGARRQQWALVAHLERDDVELVHPDEALRPCVQLSTKLPKDFLHLAHVFLGAGEQLDFHLKRLEGRGEVLRQVLVRLGVDAAADDHADVELVAVPVILCVLYVHRRAKDHVVIQHDRDDPAPAEGLGEQVAPQRLEGVVADGARRVAAAYHRAGLGLEHAAEQGPQPEA
mmetsp:Transcript_77285/g.202790  ORF Transcript_77285/g.202790 Transcript_77285/m.202790 type:complete len:278 (-) Transcript_77285:9-842(-)